MVRVIHSAVKGRARYKVEGLYRSESLKKHLESALPANEGISCVSANTLTGNVLVIYNSGNTLSNIALVIESLIVEHDRAQGFGSSLVRDEKGLKRRSMSKRQLRKLITHAEDQRLESWYLLEVADVLNRFDTDRSNGLASKSAREKLKRYGPNVLPESTPRSGLALFVDQFKSFPIALLAVASAVSVVTGGAVDAIAIMSVVFINSVIGYTTESKAEKTIYSLKGLVKPSAIVIRDGNLREINAEDVVLGDILVLRPGSYVAADARLIEATHLSVDESALTGESMPVIKTTTPIIALEKTANDTTIVSAEEVAREEVPLADRINMVYMGTLITGGQGLAVVVATGRHTEIGLIQSLVGEALAPETPMERQLRRMGSQLSLISGAVCVGVFAVGLRRYGFLQMLKVSVSLAVAAIPEGLPTVALVTLALGMRSMGKHNAIVRKVEAVETLGSVQTICLDKTGTITMNKMTVVSIHAGNHRFSVSDGNFTEGRKNINPYSCDELLRLIHVVVLCNESEVSRENGGYVVNGSSTENAFLYLAINAGIDTVALRSRLPMTRIVHRSENRNYMVTIHKSQDRQGRVIAIKGSPNEVLSMCEWQMKDGLKVSLSENDRSAIQAENERMSGDSLRVLGVAYAIEDDTSIAGDEIDYTKGLIWLGLIGMADPIRGGLKRVIGEFHNAGISTVMLTGDQASTAFAVAKELDLSRGEQLEIVDSTQLTRMNRRATRQAMKRAHVFARISPAHKLQIVQGLQKAGKVVAMTGDGINDAPALKAADIGIAMGHTGTDVAREVADLVLEDDELETMIIAVSQGRTIYNNIRKSIHFLLATNLSEIMVMFIAIALGLGQPLSAVQLLWINIMTDVAPGLALALEPPEPDVLSQPPRDPREPIIRGSDFKRIFFESTNLSVGALGAYGYGVLRYGMGQRANTMAFTSLTTGQLLHAVSSRSDKYSVFNALEPSRKGREYALKPNPYLNAAVLGSLAIQSMTLVMPRLRQILGLFPINLLDGVIVAGGTVLPFVVNESTKQQAQLSQKTE